MSDITCGDASAICAPCVSGGYCQQQRDFAAFTREQNAKGLCEFSGYELKQCALGLCDCGWELLPESKIDEEILKLVARAKGEHNE